MIRSPQRKVAWLVLFLLVVAAVLIVFVPAWLIQPFKPQTSRAISVSFLMRRWSPLLTVLALVGASALMIWIWRGTGRWWRKALLIVMILPLLGAAWFARQNHFEWMFRPLPNPAYVQIAGANFVADTDMVMAVELPGDAVAYPIRFMAYHHVVQDVVGGTPIVATY